MISILCVYSKQRELSLASYPLKVDPFPAIYRLPTVPLEGRQAFAQIGNSSILGCYDLLHHFRLSGDGGPTRHPDDDAL